jgi:hypothetical protein
MPGLFVEYAGRTCPHSPTSLGKKVFAMLAGNQPVDMIIRQDPNRFSNKGVLVEDDFLRDGSE